MRHYEPPPSMGLTRSTIRYSEDYGRTWTIVYGNTGLEPIYNRSTHFLALAAENDSVLVTDDNFNTYTYFQALRHLNTEWLPDTSNWGAYQWNYGYSFDSLQTFIWPRWGGYDDDHQFSIQDEMTSLGWSPGDMASVGTAFEQRAFYFSTDFADSFVVRGVNNLSETNPNTSFIARGVSPGEIYFFDVSYFHYTSAVSLDTMRTWSEWHSLMENNLYLGCSVEVERGWNPGELFFLLYESWGPDGQPRIALYHTTDFAETWTLQYSTIEPVSVHENSAALPSETVRIWPNPGNGRVSLSLPEDVLQLRVYNLLGKEILRSEQSSTSMLTSIDVSKFGSGIYFIQTINRKGECFNIKYYHTK